VKRTPQNTPTPAELSGALHEVSNALTVVLGWLNEARSRQPTGQVRDALEIAYTHAQRGHAVARSAISSRDAMRAGRRESNARSVGSLAKEAVLALGPQAEARGVILLGPENELDLAVEGPDAVLQVLVNLLLNAVAFTPPGGNVSLTTVAGVGTVSFCVRDQGPGVPTQQQGVLFERGQSLRPGGAGIGLAHSHALAQQHGGKLRLLPSSSAAFSAGSSSAKGASFELIWPASEAPSRTVQGVPLATLNGLTVVVLEDDLAVLTMVQMGLAARGIEVLSACGVDELREILDRGVPFDAAFIDLSPIEADPGAAVRLLRSRNSALPVIMISGSATGVGDEDLQLSAWVQKPFEIGELCRALADVMQATAVADDRTHQDTTGEILISPRTGAGRGRRASARVG
jgi:CheY-like chemotaxis protein